MNPEIFVSHFKKELDNYLQDTFSSEASAAGVLRARLEKKLDSDNELRDLIKAILTDNYYTILLGLDGSASIGGIQQPFKIYDENNNLVSHCGDIEAVAYEAFHGESN